MKFVNKILLAVLAVTVLSSAPASALTWKEVKEFTKTHKKKIIFGAGVAAGIALVTAVTIYDHKVSMMLDNVKAIDSHAKTEAVFAQWDTYMKTREARSFSSLVAR